jgi:hypothetical protein
MSHVDVQEVARRMQIDFLEWPMLRVTLRQACRLWNASPDICEAALLGLVRAEFLLDRDGTFHRPVRAAHIDGADAILGPKSLRDGGALSRGAALQRCDTVSQG